MSPAAEMHNLILQEIKDHVVALRELNGAEIDKCNAARPADVCDERKIAQELEHAPSIAGKGPAIANQLQLQLHSPDQEA